MQQTIVYHCARKPVTSLSWCRKALVPDFDMPACPVILQRQLALQWLAVFGSHVKDKQRAQTAGIDSQGHDDARKVCASALPSPSLQTEQCQACYGQLLILRDFIESAALGERLPQ